MAAMAAVGHRPWRIAAGWALLGFTLIDGSAALSVVKVTQAEAHHLDLGGLYLSGNRCVIRFNGI
jgi:hypothetical protein